MTSDEEEPSLSGWLRMKGAAVRGWKRMHFRLHGQQLSYSKSEEGHLGAMIQLAGCSLYAETGGGEQHVLCISHKERGTRKLACVSAGSLSAWLTALQTAALPETANRCAARQHCGQRARLSGDEAEACEEASCLSRARLSHSLNELRASGVVESSRNMLHDEHSDERAANSDPSPAGLASHGRSSDEGQPLTCPQALAERDEACSRAAGLIEQTIAFERRCRDADCDLLPRKRGETGKFMAAQEALIAIEREPQRVPEERQVLHRQVAKLQLVVHDIQADAETKSRESSDSLLQLKVQHEQACAAIARQYENAALDGRNQLKQMVTHAEDLCNKLAKSERIRIHKGELQQEEMQTAKTNLAMEKEDKGMLEAEVKKLRGKSSSTEFTHPCVISSTNVSKAGRTKLRCKGCGEPMHIYLNDGLTKQGGGQQEEDNDHEKVQLMKDEIDKLKSALGLALDSEHQARKEAERFTLSFQQACETLQDRIASQLSLVADAEAEKAMAIAQHKHDSAKLEKECTALEAQIKESYSTCKQYYEQCASALNDIRPAGVRHLRFDKCSRQREDRQRCDIELIETLKVRESEDIANRRAHSELFEAQSQITEMMRAAENQRAQYAKTWGELSQTRKRLMEVMAEKAQLETESKGMYQHLEELLGPGEEQEIRGILQERFTSQTEVQIAAVAAAARQAISPHKVIGNVSSRSSLANASTTSRPSGAKPINYFKGVLTNRDLMPKSVFMSPAKQDFVRERKYFPEEYVWEESAGGGENRGEKRAGAETYCADGRKGSGASSRKVDRGNNKYEIPLHRRAKVSDRSDSIARCMLARYQVCV